MTIPLPFIHLWRVKGWGLTAARGCRICGRLEVLFQGVWIPHQSLREIERFRAINEEM